MAVETRTVAARGRWERVDQLRGLAALAVVVCHLAVSGYRDAPNLDGGPWPWLALLLGFGYLGVPFFFVISAFCIHLPHARALARAGSAAPAPRWRHFFARRFWRPYPPYLAALVVALALWWVVGGSVSWLTVTAQALLVHSFHTTTFDGVNPPAWTLAVEAQLYVAYPAVFWLIARLGALRALGAVLGVTMAYRVALTLVPLPIQLAGPAWEVFLARWFEWVLGAMVAEWAAGRLTLPRLLFTPWPGLVAPGRRRAARVARRRLRALHPEGAALRGGVRAAALLGARARASGDAVDDRTLPRPGRRLLLQPLPAARPIQLAFEPLAREVATWPSVVAHGLPSSLLIMAATTPVVLWASRLFYRYCERPSIRRSQAV